MTAPVVTRLLGEIGALPNGESRAELVAHLACYYARTGELSRAAELTAELRANYGSGAYPRLSILIMLIEGLRLYFADQDPRASDRLSRACLLSGMIRDRELTSLTQAWLAHLHFNAGRYTEFGTALSRAVGNLDSENLPAKVRISISLADAFLLIGDHSNSKHWYADARDAAVKYGDQAAIGAVTYNRAALQVHAMRLAMALGTEPEQDVRLVLTEVQSAINYQRVAQLSSLDHLLFMARIGGLLASRSYKEARQCAEELIGSVGVTLTASEQIMLSFDHAFSLYKLGEMSPIRDLFHADGFLSSCASLEAGDRLIIFSGMAEVDPGLIDVDLYPKIAALRQEAESDHFAEQGRLAGAIKAFCHLPQ